MGTSMVAMATDSTDWRKLAARAMRRRVAFEMLLTLLDATITRLARSHCPLDPDAGAQEARLRLYRLVYVDKSVDVRKADSSIRAYLIHAASQEMLKQNKRLARRGMYGWGRGGQTGKPQRGETRPGERPAVLPITAGAGLSVPEIEPPVLPWPLPLFARYYELHGTLDGAVAALAAQEGLSPRKLAREYRKIVAQMKKKSALYGVTLSLCLS